ncbi:MAG: hypothetical protein M3Y50_16910 [Acidobacteriota bacterium]|nr:hypothetical protein [Acidobacteriota bacterium]
MKGRAEQEWEQSSKALVKSSFAEVNVPARVAAVNRTHRVVRERARALAASRSRLRSLWIPISVCSALLTILGTAVWSVLAQYDGASNGLPDASNQFLVLCLWFFPVSMALLAIVLFHRSRRRGDGERA